MSPSSRSFYGCPGIKQLATNRKKSHSGSLKRGLISAASTQLALFTGEMPTWDHTAFEGVDRDDKPPYNELKKSNGSLCVFGCRIEDIVKSLSSSASPKKQTTVPTVDAKKEKNTICDTHKDSTLFFQRRDNHRPICIQSQTTPAACSQSAEVPLSINREGYFHMSPVADGS